MDWLRVVWCIVAHWLHHELMDRRDVMVWRGAGTSLVQVKDWRCARCERTWTESEPI